jgi:hypothetical protein
MWQKAKIIPETHQNAPESITSLGPQDKSLMYQKSTNDLLGWVVEKIGDIPGTVAPSFGSKKSRLLLIPVYHT